MKAATAIVALALAAVALVVLVQPAPYLRWRHELRYPHTIRAHAANYGLPPALVAAVIEQESGFDHDVRSRAGAVGLMQVTPDTARGIATRTGGSAFRERDLLDPEVNIRYGCWYLRHLHRALDSPETGYTLALAAYNGGQGRVREWIADDDDGTLTVDEIPIDETRHYVARVLELRRSYEKAYGKDLRG